MFQSYPLKVIFLLTFRVLLCYADGDDRHRRSKRAIGGESLDTSNFGLYIDPNGARFIEVPSEYMNNWLDDQKMWRNWSIVLAILCCIFFITLLVFLIHGFYTSTGPFAGCVSYFNQKSSGMTISIDPIQKDASPTSQQTILLGSHHIATL